MQLSLQRLGGGGLDQWWQLTTMTRAGPLLQYWLQVRNHEGVPGTNLLPFARTGKPWTHVSLYQAIKLVMRDLALIHY